ncbi:MAG TPA: GNAT family N-acetyltransferase [Candidatus Dormibacteraeota bacterium]
MATAEDGARLAWVHIRAWQQAYAGQLPDAYLDGLMGGLDQRVARWQEWLVSNRPLVAEAGADGVIGFAFWGGSLDEGEAPTTAQLWAIYLLAEYWGRGVGRSLMEAAASSMREAGYQEANLWVLDSNVRARRFYEAAGWTADGAAKVEDHDGVELREVRYRVRLA